MYHTLVAFSILHNTIFSSYQNKKIGPLKGALLNVTYS